MAGVLAGLEIFASYAVSYLAIEGGGEADRSAFFHSRSGTTLGYFV